MSYETDIMKALNASLRNTEGLKYTLKEFNANIEVIKQLAKALDRANELKEIELGLRSREEYSYKVKTRRK